MVLAVLGVLVVWLPPGPVVLPPNVYPFEVVVGEELGWPPYPVDELEGETEEEAEATLAVTSFNKG